MSVRSLGYLAKHVVLFTLVYSSGVRGPALWATALYYLLAQYRGFYVRALSARS